MRAGDLSEITTILNDVPDCKDEEDLNRIMAKKLKYLLNENGDCGRNALHWAIHMTNMEVVSFLIIKGASPTVLTIDNYTPLQLAVQHHSTEILRLLLEQKKTDINQVTMHGSALHLAVANEDKKCIEVLLQHGADLEVVDSDGKSVSDICKNVEIKAIL